MDALIDFVGMEEDINDMIIALDRMSAKVQKSEIESMKKAAEIVAAEQKRIIGTKSSKLAGLITSSAYIKKNGHVEGRAGYSDIWGECPEALIMEFGRPGLSKSAKYRRQNMGRKKDGEQKKIGYVKAEPHIRKAWLIKKQEAFKTYLESQYNIAKEEWGK